MSIEKLIFLGVDAPDLNKIQKMDLKIQEVDIYVDILYS